MLGIDEMRSILEEMKILMEADIPLSMIAMCEIGSVFV